MLRPALAALAFAVLSLAACGGSDESASSALASQPCPIDVCGAAGTAFTARLTSFDHQTDVLEVAIGTSAETFLVSATTQPLPAEPCEEPMPVAKLIAAWNATSPMSPFGDFDIFDHDAAYHRLLVALAKAGVTASISLAPDLKTVETFQPICAPPG